MVIFFIDTSLKVPLDLTDFTTNSTVMDQNDGHDAIKSLIFIESAILSVKLN